MRPLSFTIVANISENGNYQEASLQINQDKLDELRQEYIDYSAPWTPDRGSFDRNSPYRPGLLGPAAESSIHDYWHILDTLNPFAYLSDNRYCSLRGGAINFTSGYRCPAGNCGEEGLPDSHHIFGLAFDFMNDGEENVIVCEAALYAGASVALLYGSGGGYVTYPTVPPGVWKGHAHL